MRTNVMLRRFTAAVIACCAAAAALAQPPPVRLGQPGANLQTVWHLGRVTGDLGEIIAFYHDVLGLDLRGARDQALPFTSVAKINEFVGAPPNAEFRAAFMPISGTSAATAPADRIYLEAFEYRNVERARAVAPLSSAGAASLRLVVRDLDAVLAKARAANAAFVSAGGQPVDGPAPEGFSGRGRAVMLRDPDGFAVELVELATPPATLATAESNVLAAQMSVIVTDLDASLAFHRRLIGTEDPASQRAWRPSAELSKVRALPEGEYRSASLLLPGSTIMLELIELRGLPATDPYRPAFPDIGHGHVAFTTQDIEAVLARMRELGAKPLAASGSWTEINPTLRAIYTRDPDGFFIEIIERN
jgi:catechol 2,3-dioxygenase-like lactoylglutathione lyase family enzyme